MNRIFRDMHRACLRRTRCIHVRAHMLHLSCQNKLLERRSIAKPSLSRWSPSHSTIFPDSTLEALLQQRGSAHAYPSLSDRRAVQSDDARLYDARYSLYSSNILSEAAYQSRCLDSSPKNLEYIYRVFSKSSATSTIMSSWPPTMRRLPSSTRISTALMPYFFAAISEWRRKLE